LILSEIVDILKEVKSKDDIILVDTVYQVFRNDCS